MQEKQDANNIHIADIHFFDIKNSYDTSDNERVEQRWITETEELFRESSQTSRDSTSFFYIRVFIHSREILIVIKTFSQWFKY